MKQSARRLGRGLGAFLDFGPLGGDTAAYVPGAGDEETPSVLETSSREPATVPARPAVLVEPVQSPTPPPSVPRFPTEPAQAQIPARADAAFEDEFVVGLTFPDVELE